MVHSEQVGNARLALFNVEEGFQRFGGSCTVGGDANWGSRCGQQYGASSES